MSGTYENEKGVKFEVHTDSRGKDHVNIYDGDPRGEHSSIHVNWDSSTGEGSIVDTTSGSKETTDISCYLTTACMRHYSNDFRDNCDELTILRWFRDKFVSEEDIIQYYAVAPIIVESIESLNNKGERDRIYNYIYTKIVKYCVDAIKCGEYAKAYSRYKTAVLTLEEQFIDNDLEKVKMVSLLN